MNNKTRKRLDQLANLIQRSGAKAIMKLVCPDCGDSLSIQYTSLGKGALAVTCTNCTWRVITDGVATTPPWVQALGKKVLTGKQMLAKGKSA